ncbi:uncharacterized protein BDZ99DRAFT_191730 [Mytilinidion resinicola]|uniref:Mid2 domain-containing protein n=1 Tax=Mytilinidion resinicola TaxID=574789 RepID=A0A6A6Z2X2_9PEZI|nr:uncharacterized protein BDZ99DRAFT_191730 [Mytilinidion resinicola]KAF2815168.1 hypothetical protein BDZ99DRAFT_191730 [Mytilinidion resinicola]
MSIPTRSVTNPSTTSATSYILPLPSSSSPPKKTVSTGVIVGAIVGGVALLVTILGVTTFRLFRHRKPRQRENSHELSDSGVPKMPSKDQKLEMVPAERAIKCTAESRTCLLPGLLP